MKGLQKQPVQRYLGKVSKLRDKRSDKVILHVMIPPLEFKKDNEQLSLAVVIGEDILCAKVFHKMFGTVTMGEDQCEIDIWKRSQYWCLTVTSENQWDYVNDRYELEMRRVQFPIINLKTKIDLQREAEVLCMIQKQNSTVASFKQGNPDKMLIPGTDKPDNTSDTSKIISGVFGEPCWQT